MATQSEHFGGLGYGKGKSAGKGRDIYVEDLMNCIVEEGGMPIEELIDLLDKFQRYIQQRASELWEPGHIARQGITRQNYVIR